MGGKRYKHKCPHCETEFKVKWDREDMAPLQHCPYCGYYLQKDRTIEEVHEEN